MSTANKKSCARALQFARRSSQPYNKIASDLEPSDIASAYEIQQALADLDVLSGRSKSGWKIGITSQKTLDAFGATEPMVGHIWSDRLVDDGAKFNVQNAISPKIEGEILFKVGTPCAADASDTDVIASIFSVHAAFEIADSRLEGWPRNISHAIADNACCGWVAIADRGVPASTQDLSQVRMVMTSAGQTLSEGSGVNCLGNPLNVYRWFLQFAERTNRRVEPGDIILTGAMGPPVSLQAGRAYELEISGVGQISIVTE